VDAPSKFSAGPSRNPSNHYKTMTIAQIAALPVGELAHPDGCRLVMWMTCPHLKHMHILLAAWGFKYCTGRPWLKIWPKEDGLILHPDSFATGTDYEVINTTEPMIIAKRGRPENLIGRTKWKGHVIASRREHSRKPDRVRDEIAELFDGPRCELFARSRLPAFDSWGDEVGLFDGGVA
jgi:N6-adenosine-specific RNA methylase IME4